MDEYAQEIQKKMDELPANVRQFIYSPEMSKILQEIGAQHQLHIDQIGALEAEAAAVMIGVTEPDEFITNISDSLNVDTSTSEAIAKDVNEKLFIKTREDMKALTEKPKQEEIIKGPAAVAAPAPMPVSTPMVAMPSASKPAVVAPSSSTILSTAPAVVPAQPVSKPAPAPVSVVQPAPKAPAPDLMAADAMLSEKKVAAPATSPAPVAPQPYKADPYREPAE